ncbi:MAG: glutamate racemase [Dehalococcoidia bacterium]
MSRPIGVFDSGIGGLTVLREIVRALPDQSIVFLGDTARVPYGTRGIEVISGFAAELADFLIARDVQYLVAACNTISSTCLDELQERVPVPVLGVVEPAVRAAVSQTNTRRIGIIGTRATVGSGFYAAQINAANPGVEVFSQACPLFVPLAEEGMLNAPPTRLIAADYLAPLQGKGIDTLILGCTHYPLLRSVIQDVMGPEVTLVDSAAPTAEDLAHRLAEGGFERDDEAPSYDLFVTDAPGRVETVARLFFGEELPGRLQRVTL